MQDDLSTASDDFYATIIANAICTCKGKIYIPQQKVVKTQVAKTRIQSRQEAWYTSLKLNKDHPEPHNTNSFMPAHHR